MATWILLVINVTFQAYVLYHVGGTVCTLLRRNGAPALRIVEKDDPLWLHARSIADRVGLKHLILSETFKGPFRIEEGQVIVSYPVAMRDALGDAFRPLIAGAILRSRQSDRNFRVWIGWLLLVILVAAVIKRTSLQGIADEDARALAFDLIVVVLFAATYGSFWLRRERADVARVRDLVSPADFAVLAAWASFPGNTRRLSPLTRLRVRMLLEGMGAPRSART